MSAYVKLGDDLDAVIASYNNNPARTNYQIQTWFKDGKKKAITHSMLGRNHPKSLRLARRDGYDGQPVGSRKVSSARRFWDYGAGHIFPPQNDLVRLGVFLHLDIYRTTALLLKRTWEIFYCRKVKGWRANRGQAVLDLLLEADDHLIQETGSRFDPDAGGLFELFSQVPPGAWHEGYTQDSLTALLREMVLADLHRQGVFSREMAAFVDRKREEMHLLRAGTVEQQQAFLLTKLQWIRNWDELGDLSLAIENQRLRNAAVTHRWMKVFGSEELACREQWTRCRNLETRYNLKNADPALTRDQLETQVKKVETERKKELAALRYQARPAPVPATGGEASRPLEPEQAHAYRSRCKTLARDILKLIHEDHLKSDPVYQQLTEQQKDTLQQMLHQTLDIRSEELRNSQLDSPNCMRSLDVLLDIRMKVDGILENVGIDTNVEMIIQGACLPDQLAWLEHQNKRLDRQVDWARARLQALVEDKEMRQKAAILENPGQQAGIRADLETRTNRYREAADQLETALDALFVPSNKEAT